jgi:hypothetical protein
MRSKKASSKSWLFCLAVTITNYDGYEDVA